jgi:hypothetical protein
VKPSALPVLNYLRRNRTRLVPATELADNVCIDYRSRICELAREGYVFEKKWVRIGKTRCKAFRLLLEVQG